MLPDVRTRETTSNVNAANVCYEFKKYFKFHSSHCTYGTVCLFLEQQISGLSQQVLDPSQQDQRPSLSSASTGQAVKLLSTHLPDFSGSEDEDFESWVYTIERVARIHGVSNDVLLLAATGKLKKISR